MGEFCLLRYRFYALKHANLNNSNMDILQIIILALVQGISEFLPISSSAHLILTSELLRWESQGPAFDIAVHVGTLTAVVGYFWRDIRALLLAWLGSFVGEHSPLSRLAWVVILASLPLIPMGIGIKLAFGETPRWPLLIAFTTIIFGLLLWWADRMAKRIAANPDLVSIDREQDLTWKQGLFIGCAQALALLPGTSRSGVTITAGLALGMNRTAAARFSFLLSIPAILMSGAAVVLSFGDEPSVASGWDMLWGALIAGGFAALTIHWFLKFIDRVGMLPFVIYRLVLGVLLLVLIGFGVLPSGL